MTQGNAALVKGRWAEYVANVIERIPQKLGTVGRYAAITRGMVLFRSMQ